jgi:hypothetical protein
MIIFNSNHGLGYLVYKDKWGSREVSPKGYTEVYICMISLTSYAGQSHQDVWRTRNSNNDKWKDDYQIKVKQQIFNEVCENAYLRAEFLLREWNISLRLTSQSFRIKIYFRGLTMYIYFEYSIVASSGSLN